ncbi:MAG TPA: response regulator, partial [Candidatus Binatia bacterium]|nr:response regulator [Candidatus Binatia bacterium]
MKTLIVEDDMMSQCLLAQVLTERGHEVVTYENAEQAILAYQKQFFPLLFVDVGLPGMNGLQFCKWVRSQSQGEKAFIMVATSSGEPADVSEVLAVGANDFLSKPYEVGTLNVRLSIAEGQMKEFFERQELEDSLRQRREAFDRLVHTAHEGVWLLDAQFHADYVNPQMAEILGYQVEELIHRAVIDFVAEPAQREAEQMFAEQKEGRPIQRELRFRRKDRSECLTFLSATPVRTANGEFEGSLWMVADLTQRTTLESDLADTRKGFESRVRDLTGELNQAAQSLQAETAEREKVKQTLQHTRTDLEKLGRERAAEFAQKTDEVKAETANRQRIEAQLARTAEELRNEIAEHKSAEQELAKARE